ncbi:MAG: glycerate dehydrogenase [SAR92 bacterium BACL26 MAG-121220-bin70]|jgi:glycerate dehydrogenase|uniref:Glycerate dehydrogenase n=1 Tax=SAR92 bacterium BACL26 MAG-121220-bin70 TaxID=1655626 RepID=A0A0R2U6I0_9GAMM|nr:MAG: glycerate dehydrogenase [SAR92 bacterium BACL26 MAG-121220-bin70]
MKGVILDFDSIGPTDLDLTSLHQLPIQWTIYPDCKASQVADRIAHADIVLTNKTAIRASEMVEAKNLKLIALFATGTDIIDLAGASAKNIVVSNAIGYGTASVVQHVWSLILALTTNLNEHSKAATDGRWRNSRFFCLLDSPVQELDGKVLGIVGAGELGLGVAKIAEAFGMKVFFASLPGRAHSHSNQVSRMPFNELLKTVDILSLHCPLTAATTKLIGADELGSMKGSALLINTARGGLIDEKALKDALTHGVIAGAAVDVLSVEPPSEGNVLIDSFIPNLIVTPHVAWIARESRQRLVNQVAGNVKGFLEGQPRNQVR